MPLTRPIQALRQRASHYVTGENLLRDAPHDHLHHHALMYGIRVNGVNFWEETPG